MVVDTTYYIFYNLHSSMTSTYAFGFKRDGHRWCRLGHLQILSWVNKCIVLLRLGRQQCKRTHIHTSSAALVALLRAYQINGVNVYSIDIAAVSACCGAETKENPRNKICGRLLLCRVGYALDMDNNIAQRWMVFRVPCSVHPTTLDRHLMFFFALRLSIHWVILIFSFLTLTAAHISLVFCNS